MAALAACFALSRLGFASIAIGSDFLVNFADPKDINAHGTATWFPSDKFDLTSEGLGYNGNPNDDRWGWFITNPQALGLSWRPTSSAGFRVELVPTAKSGKWYPDNGHVYVRYSPDTKHWSNWQALEQPQPPAPSKSGAIIFTGQIEIPWVEREKYQLLLAEYAKQDVPWKSDEEAAVKWIVGQDLHFFESNLPFAGYIQFMYEQNFRANERISRFDAEIWVGMSGLHIPPKDPAIRKDRDGPNASPWRYKAE